jgi:flagellar hook protein FlgE
MLSVIMSGLNVAQKDLQVASNNVANAGTVGFKRSVSSFADVFSNDPSANPKTAVGSGAITSMISRNTSQGAMTSTDKVTDLAIAGRGYFTLASTDPETGARNVVYTRAGNFTVNVKGEIVDASDNQLQVFPVNSNGKVDTTQTIGASISSEKDPADVRVPLSDTAGVGATVVVKLAGNTVVTTPAITQTDIDNGYVTVSTPGVSSDNSSDLSASYDVTKVSIPFDSSLVSVGDQVRFTSPDSKFVITRTITTAEQAAGSLDVDVPVTVTNTNIAQATADFLTSGGSAITGALSGSMSAVVSSQVASSEYRGVYLQGITIDSKGMVQATYGDGSKTDVGAIALASFRNDSALKPIGNTKFVASDQSGTAIMTRAGAPFAGDILSGTLEQANVDITQELMTMLKAQQLYNGNARMLQAAMEVGSRVTDKI